VAYTACLVALAAIAVVGAPSLMSWPPLAPMFGAATPGEAAPVPDVPEEIPGLPADLYASATAGAASTPEVPPPAASGNAGHAETGTAGKPAAPADRKLTAAQAAARAAKRAPQRPTPQVTPAPQEARSLDLSSTASTRLPVTAPVAPVVPTRVEPDVDPGPAFEVTQVDVRPVITRQTYPRVPGGTSIGGQPEVVVVRVLVSRSGRAADVRVVRGSRASREFDEAAIAAVREWSFTPAQRRSKAVSCWMHVGVSFRAGDGN
jgi:protein TonB